MARLANGLKDTGVCLLSLDNNPATAEADWLRWGHLPACLHKRVIGKARPRESASLTQPQRSSLTPRAGPCLTGPAAHGGPCLLWFSGFPQSGVLESESVPVAGVSFL
uniref:uncharacterized protein LOC103796327 n=1 Tax=Callithrix jacchus TaxID=9483 RepID=UPI0023DD60DA|nr:uncharacterized protein LOC103796327 [Callithrix jacchus]